MSEPGTWRDQLERVSRWLERIEQTYSGRTHDRATEHYQDEVYAFFQNCYHLKDWLKNDEASAARVSDVEDFVPASDSLSVCADLANGSKHLRLTRRPRRDPKTRIEGRHYDLRIGEGEPTIAVKYEVHAGGQVYDAFALARNCWSDWQAYLLDKGLIDARTVPTSVPPSDA